MNCARFGKMRDNSHKWLTSHDWHSFVDQEGRSQHPP
jgi:hypothetical protein